MGAEGAAPCSAAITGSRLPEIPHSFGRVRRANPILDEWAAPGEDGPEEEQGERGCGSAVDCGGESLEPLARGGYQVRGCHLGRLRSGLRLVL